MRLKFSKGALKFLTDLSPTEQKKVKNKLKILITAIQDNGSIPFQELDIKTLKGEWKGFLRMRIGKMRIIFSVSPEEILIYSINFRGDIYKKK